MNWGCGLGEVSTFTVYPFRTCLATVYLVTFYRSPFSITFFFSAFSFGLIHGLHVALRNGSDLKNRYTEPFHTCLATVYRVLVTFYRLPFSITFFFSAFSFGLIHGLPVALRNGSDFKKRYTELFHTCLTTVYWLPFTFYPLPFLPSYLSPFTVYLLPTAYCLPPIACCLKPILLLRYQQIIVFFSFLHQQVFVIE